MEMVFQYLMLALSRKRIEEGHKQREQHAERDKRKRVRRDILSDTSIEYTNRILPPDFTREYLMEWIGESDNGNNGR
jgi:hypothetical protein